MKLRIVWMAAAFCLAGFAQSQSSAPATQSNNKSTESSANRLKRAPATTEAQTIKGCVDQQNGHYVMRDVETSQIVNLQAPGAEDEWFAKFVGHQVQASGDKSSSTLKVSSIHQIADMCGSGK